ncbi:hypothetical protein [Alicyclobacillus tolerans]|nr:hypothetical protein [Alicyclobacillus montanus]
MMKKWFSQLQPDKKSLLTGAVVGTLFGSLLAGGAVFAATSNFVQAQKEIANYDGIKGSALVYGGTTYAELYAVQQVLQKQGIVNQWNGDVKNFSMDSPSQSLQQLSSENSNLDQQVGDFKDILKSIEKLPSNDQQQVLNQLNGLLSSTSTSTNTSTSDNSTSDLNVWAKGLLRAEQETEGNPGNANSVLQNLIQQFSQKHGDHGDSQDHQNDGQDGQNNSQQNNGSDSGDGSTTGSVYGNTGDNSGD